MIVSVGAHKIGDKDYAGAGMVGRNFLIVLPIDPCELMETRHLERDSFVLFDVFGVKVFWRSFSEECITEGGGIGLSMIMCKSRAGEDVDISSVSRFSKQPVFPPTGNYHRRALSDISRMSKETHPLC
jgi:hypothetical protein